MTPVVGAMTCPRPEHAGSRVIRHGRSEGLGRQRYRCVPVLGRPHTFSVFPGFVDDSPGAAPARMHLRYYRYRAVDIARALESLGRGATYRQAALRASAGRLVNGQLVANWVRAFGGIVPGPATPPRGPPVPRAGALPPPPGRSAPRPAGPLAAPPPGRRGPAPPWGAGGWPPIR